MHEFYSFFSKKPKRKIPTRWFFKWGEQFVSSLLELHDMLYKVKERGWPFRIIVMEYSSTLKNLFLFFCYYYLFEKILYLGRQARIYENKGTCVPCSFLRYVSGLGIIIPPPLAPQKRTIFWGTPLRLFFISFHGLLYRKLYTSL